MAKGKYIEQIFSVSCSGRDARGNEVLQIPVAVSVRVGQSAGEKNIRVSVECLFNTGGHGQRCRASHPKVDKVGSGVGCPYVLDIPYALEKQ